MRDYTANVSMAKRGMDKHRYLELKHICRQYGKYVSEEQALQEAIVGGFNSFELTGMPHGTDITDPTARRVVQLEKRRERLSARINAIEQAAQAVDAYMAPYLIRNVTEGVPWEYLDVACARRTFYDARRAFFDAFDKKMEELDCTEMEAWRQ